MNLLHERRRLLAMPGYAFGDGGDSSQSSATTTTNSTTATDNRAVADGGSTIVGAGAIATVNNTVTDLNAIQKAADLAQAAITGSTLTATNSAANAGKLAVAALDLGGQALGELKGAYKDANEQAQAVASGNKTLAITGLVIAGILAATVWQQRKSNVHV